MNNGFFVAATYTDPCKRNNKDFSGCLKNTLQYLIPKFSKGNTFVSVLRGLTINNNIIYYNQTIVMVPEGIPQLNITNLDPFYLNEYLMHFESPQIEGKSLFKDVYNHGLGSIKILDVR